MRIFLEWLKDFVDVGQKTAEEISKRLSLSGTEVEGIDFPWGTLEGAVTGKVVESYPHPAVSHLLVTKIDTAEKTITIVTSDTSVTSEEIVAVLPEGSKLQGRTIEGKEFAGIRSEGMFLSLEELHLEEKSTRILRLLEVAPGTDVKKLLKLDGQVIEVELTANRGDCLSIVGIARELGALYGASVTVPEVEDSVTVGSDRNLKVTIEDPGCKRYTALLLENVTIAPSPLWLKRRLVAAGLRPINNVVDITNYVMLETGHPVHAFDVDRIGSTEIVVRAARENEKLVLLDGRQVELEESDMLITNGDTPLALAGVMGGEASGIDSNTRRVLLEVAVFDPVTIRKTSRRLGLSTDSSYRFERGIDYTDSVYVIRRLADLVRKLAGASIGSSVVDVGTIEFPARISLRESFVHERLGKVLRQSEIESILLSLGFELERTEYGWYVIPPAFRVCDIKHEIDLVEEIGRIFGYDRIDNILPKVLPISAGVPDYLKRQAFLKEILVAGGFDEIVSYSFVNPDDVTKLDDKIICLDLQNPLSQDMAVLRPSLILGLLAAISYNYRRQNRDLKFFEIGSIFSPLANTKEKVAVGFAAIGRENPADYSDKRSVDFFTVKGIIEEILEMYGVEYTFKPQEKTWLEKRSAVSVVVEGQEVGFFGAFNSSLGDKLYEIKSGELYLGQIDLTLLDSIRRDFAGAKNVSQYPRVFRDLSFLVPVSLNYLQLEETIRSRLRESALSEISVSDIYRGRGVDLGFRSITVTLAFESFDRTLTDGEVNSLIEDVLEEVSKLGVKLRG